MTETTAPPRKYTPIEQETRDLILYIRRRRWRYFAIMLLLGVYFFYLFKYKILDYSSTATFLINDHSIIRSSLELESMATNDNYIRVYELVNSAAAQKHLIDKFKLIHHYGIDTTKEFYLQKAVEKIRSSIKVSKNPFNAISVTVTDQHRYLASDMANEIVAFVEKLNQQYYISSVQKKLMVSEGLVNDLEKRINPKIVGIDSIISKLNAMIVNRNVSEKSAVDLLNIQHGLSQTIGGFRQSTEELINSQKTYYLTLQAINTPSLPTITVLRTAMPAPQSIVYRAFLFSLLSMTGVFLLLVIQAYFYLNFKEYISLILWGK